MKLLFDIIGAVILSISVLYTSSKILGFSIFKSSILKSIILLILLTIYLLSSYYILNHFLVRYMIFIFIVSILLSKFYNKKFNESFIAAFFTWILSAMAELVFAFILSGIFKIELSNFYGLIICNITVATFLFVTINNKTVQRFLKEKLSKIVNLKKYYIVVLLFILSTTISIIIYINYFDLNKPTSTLLSIVVIIVYSFITIILLNEKNENLKMQYEYDSLTQNLNEYEKMIEYQRVSNHENKNQLLVIKGLIEKKDSKTVEYINSIIKECNEPNDKFLYQTNKIPSGGLRGLIYYKVLLMKDKKINIELNIENSVRKIDFENLGININRDLCKIVGVLLDNAIEAVEDIENKNIAIDLSYKNKKFEITISNNFEGLIDLNSIDKRGYSTKGEGHGYGLSLVKEIVNNNKFENRREIKSNIFMQHIIINKI